MKTRFFIVLMMLVFAVNALAQNNYKLEFIIDNADREFKIPTYKSNFKDTLERDKEVKRFLTTIQSNGYVEVYVLSRDLVKQTLTLNLDLGAQYKWSSLEFNSTQWQMLKGLQLESVDFNNKNFNYNELIALQEDIIVRFENSGYPFASTKLDNISIKDKQINAELIVDKGQLIKIDTIELFGFKDISLGYIQQYLGIKIGDEYNESKFVLIDDLIKRLDFIQMDKPFVVKFRDNSASLELYLKEKRNNQFNGIVGFQQDGESDELEITGNLDLKLINSFGRGERIGVVWESTGNESQFLEVNLEYPYLFNSSIGTALDFKIDKLDSTYVNLEYKPAVRFALGGQDYISIYAHVFESSYLQIDSDDDIDEDLSDISSQSFGLGVYLNRLDNIFNPRKGYNIEINADGGFKQFSPLSEDVVASEDELVFRAYSTMQYFIPLFKTHTIKLANSNALFHSKTIGLSELYKIGGFKSLRGFDEQSLYASFYNISTIEYRLLFQEYSYLGAFYDIAQVVSANDITDTGVYQSFGLSFNFSTKAGVFGLSYAIGKYEGNSFEFGDAKIHFGYMTVF